MFLPFANAAAPSKGVEKHFVDPLIERREFRQFFEVPEYLIAGRGSGQLFEQGGMTAAKAPALGGEPTVEARVAVDL